MNLTADNVAEYAALKELVSGSAQSRVEPLAGGVSCAAFRLHPAGAEPVVIKQALPQLRVQAEWHSDPVRSEREAGIIEILNTYLGAANVPRLLLNDRENHIVAMASAPLDATNWKSDMLDGYCDHHVAHEVGRILGEIQAIPPRLIPRDLWDKQFFWQLRLEAYLLHTAGKLSWASDRLRHLVAKLDDSHACLVHGDFTPKNLLVSGSQVVVLDYEVAHIGQPAFDAASILNHLFLKSVLHPEWSHTFLELAQSYLEGYLKAAPTRKLPLLLVPLLGALMLARVHGKSPVEYLGPEHDPVVTGIGRWLLEFDDDHPLNLEEVWEQLEMS